MSVKYNQTAIMLVPTAFALIGFLSIGAMSGDTFPQRTAEMDRQSLIELENQWLTAENTTTLDQILASDFIHPVPTGDFLTKAQHIEWFAKHRPPANFKVRFDRLEVRLYGDMGIVNGSVITTNGNGKEIGKNVFTDIFVYRDGHWQAVNAQETDAQKR